MRPNPLAIAVAVLALTCGGCQKRKPLPPDHTAAIGEGLAAAEALRVAAQGNVTAARPYAKKPGKLLLDRANADMDDQGESLAKAGAGLVKEREARLASTIETIALRAALDVAIAERDAERRQWVGDRTYKTARWVVGIAVAAWLGLGIAGTLLSGYFGVAGIGWVGGHLLKILPFANPFYWLRNRIRGAGGNGGPTTVVNVGTQSNP